MRASRVRTVPARRKLTRRSAHVPSRSSCAGTRRFMLHPARFRLHARRFPLPAAAVAVSPSPGSGYPWPGFRFTVPLPPPGAVPVTAYTPRIRPSLAFALNQRPQTLNLQPKLYSRTPTRPELRSLKLNPKTPGPYALYPLNHDA